MWDAGGAYVETDHVFTSNVTNEWNHGLGQIVTVLLDAGMTITGLVEHDSVPWEALPGYMTQMADNLNEWRLTDRPWRLPHSYTLQAGKQRLVSPSGPRAPFARGPLPPRSALTPLL